MKLFILVYYFFRSVFLRGPLKTLALWPEERRWDKRLGIDTRHFELEPTEGMHHYQGAPYLILKTIFDQLELLTNIKRIIDIGSGMGRVLFYAESRGFTWLRGIELNAKLVAVAKQNQGRCVAREHTSDLVFVHSNATSFDYLPEACVYFLFNPFGAEVLRNTLERIRVSAQEDCWFVYMNPLFNFVFEEMGFVKQKVLKTNFYTEAIFYKLEVARQDLK